MEHFCHALQNLVYEIKIWDHFDGILVTFDEILVVLFILVIKYTFYFFKLILVFLKTTTENVLPEAHTDLVSLFDLQHHTDVNNLAHTNALAHKQ